MIEHVRGPKYLAIVSGYVIAQGQSDRERPLLSGSGGLGAQVFREKILKVVEYVTYD